MISKRISRFLPCILLLWGGASRGQEVQWEPVPPLSELPGQKQTSETELQAGGLVWELVPATVQASPAPYLREVGQRGWELVPASIDEVVQTSPAQTTSDTTVVWEPVSDEEMTIVEEQIDPPTSTEEAIARATQAFEQQAPTFANNRALWRNERWLPQISSDVPIGFGPMGVMTTFGLNTIDCTTSGECKGTSDWNNYLDQIESFGEAQLDWTVGFGNSQDLIGVVATASSEETAIPLGNRNTNSNRSILSNYYIGLHLTRNLGIDTAIRLGIENWIDVKSCGPYCGFPKSAYGVISQRIRLKDKQDTWLSNAYITAGLGNGEFRSVSQKFQASVAAQRSAGCFTYGYYEGDNCTPLERATANNRSVSYGELAPIGSLAIEIHESFNVISEWSQGNLSAGFSFRPFKDLGLTFTSMWGSLIQNCDWGCKVPIPDVPGGVELEPNLTTDRVKWSFNISFDVKL